MKKTLTCFLIACFMTACFSGPSKAGWSLLEDFQMQDVVGEEGVCVAILKQECDSDIRRHGREYPDDVLAEDMDAVREQNLETIYSLSLPGETVTLTMIAMPMEPKPIAMGAPFFESPLYSPDMSGWEALADQQVSAEQAP